MQNIRKHQGILIYTVMPMYVLDKHLYLNVNKMTSYFIYL